MNLFSVSFAIYYVVYRVIRVVINFPICITSSFLLQNPHTHA